MLQTLYFKFTAHPDSVYIFTTLGIEPYGRIGTGVLELCASILLFIPRIQWLGALMGLGLMGGAILSHVGKLGINVNNDHGQLFAMACIVFVCCLWLTWIDRKKIPLVGKLF